jgi:transposase-like protein
MGAGEWFMGRSAAVLRLDDGDRATLMTWSRSSSVRAGVAVRARVVLAVADGEGPSSVARRLGVSRPTVTLWRDRFLANGLDGLDDASRSGRPKLVDDAAILAATLEPPRTSWP